MELNLPFSDPAPVVNDVEEPSVLEYAREQGVCIDYTTDLQRLPDLCIALDHIIDRDFHDHFDDDLINAATAAEELTKQKLGINREAALFLKSTLALQRHLSHDLLDVVGSQQWIRDMKQELPILQTDAELDMLSFGSKVEPDLKDIQQRLPSEILDEEKDDGLGRPAKYFSYPLQHDATIRNERLAVTREAMTFLQNALTDEYTPEDSANIMAEASEGRENLASRHLTPPLLPLSPPMTPYVLSSPVNRLPLISESSDSVLAEAKALEEHVMVGDSLLRHDSCSSDPMLLEVTKFDALFDAHDALKENSLDEIPKTSRRKSEDLKVEGPLTPPIFSDSPMKKLKSVSFSNMIQVGDTLQPWSEDRSKSAGSQNSISDELAKQIGPIVKDLNERIENEKLIGADTVARVKVPSLDLTLSVAPWNEFSQRKKGKRHSASTELGAQMKFLQHVKDNELRSAAAWCGVSDLDLRWCWYEFPDFTITLDEKLHGETELAKIQNELRAGEIARSSGEVWKREGLRVLADDEDDEEDEIEPAEFERLRDIKSLIRKRQLELEEQDEIEEAQHSRKQAVAARLEAPGHVHLTSVDSNSKQSHKNTLQHKNTDVQKDAPTELMFGGFSASTALHKFMESQGKTVTAAKGSHKVESDHTRSIQDPTSRIQEPPTISTNLSTKDIGRNATFSKPVTRPPVSSFGLPDASFIISTALLQRRVLVREIERLHPKVDLIYRDYALSHSLCLEADIILSPSTGVLLTTLQQIKQAPLPGRVARLPVKEQIARLQLRHEKLLVLVSEGLREENSNSRPEDTRDKDSLRDLKLFATRSEGSVVVEYIPGGEKELARATVENMGKYGLPHVGSDMHDIKLFPVETTWETFLRRAGLNPFAAQFIVASLKVPTIIALPSIQSSPTVHTTHRTVEAAGLSMFILMGHEDRVKHFQAIMGGRRILDRVSGQLDQRWLSAAHGFKM